MARAWAAQARLCGKFRRLAQRKNSKNVVATAVLVPTPRMMTSRTLTKTLYGAFLDAGDLAAAGERAVVVDDPGLALSRSPPMTSIRRA